jgi:protein KRI1
VPFFSVAYDTYLASYIMNRGWIDRSAGRIPTYGEVLSTQSKGKGKEKQETLIAGSDSNQAGDDDQALPTADPELDDDDFEDVVDRFESSYNFRFEEP